EGVEQLLDDRVLVAEVIVEVARTHAERHGDGARRDVGLPLLVEEAAGLLEDAPARALRAQRIAVEPPHIRATCRRRSTSVSRNSQAAERRPWRGASGPRRSRRLRAVSARTPWRMRIPWRARIGSSSARRRTRSLRVRS